MRLSFSAILWQILLTILLILVESCSNSGFPVSFMAIPKSPSAIFLVEAVILLIPRTILLSTILLMVRSNAPKIISILKETIKV